jgi:polynuc_phos: polyribonucleotide nucleotidyltransferase
LMVWDASKFPEQTKNVLMMQCAWLKQSLLFLKWAKFIKVKFVLLCLTVHSSNSCRARMVCCTSPKLTGNVWKQ